MAELNWNEMKLVTIVTLLVVLKTLEIVYRKLAQWSQAAKERQEASRSGGAPPSRYEPPPPPPPQVQESAEAPPPAPGQVYLPYEEVAEQIFGPYIEMRKQMHKARQAPKPVVYDDVVIIEEAPARKVRVARAAPTPVVAAPPPPLPRPVVAPTAPPEPVRLRSSMTPEQARKAFLASLIFSPPPALRRLRGR